MQVTFKAVFAVKLYPRSFQVLRYRKFIQPEIAHIIPEIYWKLASSIVIKSHVKNNIDSTYITNFRRLIMSPYICTFYLFYVSAFAKSSPAGRIQVCLTARIKFTGVPAETAGEISFEEIHSMRKMGSRVALKAVRSCDSHCVEQSVTCCYCQT